MGSELTMRKRAMKLELSIIKSDGVSVHHQRERWGDSSP